MEIITLIIAIYGAFISTILGVWEIRKERKKVSIILIRDEYTVSYTITITNIGHRPITLIGMTIETKKELIPQSILRSGYIDEESTWTFPVVLEDGEHTSIKLAENLSKILMGEGIKSIIVFDAEGNSHNQYQKISYDTKLGKYYRVN